MSPDMAGFGFVFLRLRKFFWHIPDFREVFSSTIVFGPKARDSKAQANGLGHRETPKLLPA